MAVPPVQSEPAPADVRLMDALHESSILATKW